MFDDSQIEVEENVLLDLIETNPDLCLTKILMKTFLLQIVRHLVCAHYPSRQMVRDALTSRPGVQDVLEEYQTIKTLDHRTRREMTAILVSHMRDALEHFYDPDTGKGYLNYRLKTVSRKTSRRSIKKSISPQSGGPTHRRKTDLDTSLLEAISFLVHSADEKQIYQKMELFQYRQELVYSPDRSTNVLTVLPRFLDIKGLMCDVVNQDFLLMFDNETSSKLLEKWDTVLKPKVKLARSLTTTTDLRRLLKSAEKLPENDSET
ncbi:unnamed protein product, partial [Coregonus sp. 'balchen']